MVADGNKTSLVGMTLHDVVYHGLLKQLIGQENRQRIAKLYEDLSAKLTSFLDQDHPTSSPPTSSETKFKELAEQRLFKLLDMECTPLFDYSELMLRGLTYRSKTPLNQLGNISVPDSSTITIQVWDINLIKQIESAITESSLGINPQIDGQLIRLPIPKLSEERRQELSKIASEYAENSKIVIRNIRRDFIEINKKEKKESNISEDELKKILNDIQKITDNNINTIEKILEEKKKDILKV